MNSSLTVDLLSEYKKGTVALTPSELQHENDAQSPLHYSPPDADSLSDGAVSMTSRESAHFSSDMQQFFSDVEVIKKHIRSIQAGTGRMTHMGTSYGMATTSAQESALSAETSKVVAESSKCAQIAKQMITLMRENNERLRISPSNKQGEQRIRENLTNTLTRKFVEVMKDYQNSQQLFKVSIKKKVTRQVRIVHPKATPEEVETIVRNPEAAAGLFQKAILDGAPDGEITNMCQEVKDKYSEVLALERSIADLNQMFLDFALLIEQQGEMLDQIEFQVKEATDFVDQANVELATSVELQIGLRKKQCMCMLLGLLIVGAIGTIIYVLLKH